MKSTFLFFFVIVFVNITANAAEENETNGEPAIYTAPEAPAPSKSCFIDRDKWVHSRILSAKWISAHILEVYYQSSATIRTLENGNRYIQIWISRLMDRDTCQYDKEYVLIDCPSRSKGKTLQDLTPVDPDSDDYDLLDEICAGYSVTKNNIKRKSKK